jgi:hypothetical protein
MTYAALAKLKKNSVPTTLSAGINDSVTTIPVAETSVFHDADGVLITKGIVIGYDDATVTATEEITITGASATSGPGNLTTATRGVKADGTIGAGVAWGSGTKIAVMFSTGIYDQICDNIAAHESGKAATSRKLDDFGTPDDNTDLNANTTNHGLVVKAVAPAANLLNVVGIANGETAYTNKAIFDATNPEMNGTAGPGTAVVAAHRDHVHASDTSRFATANGIDLADGKSVKVVKALGTDLTSSGITVTLTAHANVAFGDVCFINSDGEAALADSDAEATMPVVCMAIATISADASGLFLLVGIARKDDWTTWTPGAALYASGTPGALTATAPGTGKNVQIVGRALTADIILFKPDNTWITIT